MYKPRFDDKAVYRIIKYKKRAVSAAFMGIIFGLTAGGAPVLAEPQEFYPTPTQDPGTTVTVPGFVFSSPSVESCTSEADNAVIDVLNSDVLAAQITSLGLQTAALIAEQVGEGLQSNTVTQAAGSAAVIAALALQIVELGVQGVLIGYEVTLNNTSKQINSTLPECATNFAGDVVIYDDYDLYVGGDVNVNDNVDIGENLDVGGVMTNEDLNGQGTGVDGVDGGQMLTGIDDNGVHFSSGKTQGVFHQL